MHVVQFYDNDQWWDGSGHTLLSDAQTQKLRFDALYNQTQIVEKDSFTVLKPEVQG